jgi:murein DD-endopeptidase MepM/ murein hydrolase activator NlpD
MSDVLLFVRFLQRYILSRLVQFGLFFENIKDLIVALLIVKRGKYSSSFLNTTFLLLVVAVLIVAPTIAENNPFINSLDQSDSPYQNAVLAFDPFENNLATAFSEKPRDKVIEHPVVSGDTLEALSKKYQVSIDSIKWANDMKSDTIKPGQSLKIPPVTGVVHKVASGDNIYSIAKKYKTDAQKIVNFPFNDFADLDTFQLTPGQPLFVPDGVIEEEQPFYRVPSYAKAIAGIKGSSNFIWPTTGGISQYPIWYHMAYDIANPAAPPVIASDTGSVIFAGCVTYGYGCHIIIDHGNGYQTLYAHLSVMDVSAGQAVSQGQKIGTMGNTGRSTGTHLHFEVRSGGVLLNPQNFLK